MNGRKRNTAILTLAGVALAFAMLQISCVSKYTTARLVIKVGQAATAVADASIKSYIAAKETECQAQVCKALHPGDQVKYQACLKSDLSANADYVKCIIPIVKPKRDWPKAYPLISAGWVTALAFVDMAEQLEAAGQPVDWGKVLDAIKATSCLTSKSLELLPDKQKAKAQMIIKLMGTWGCTAPTS